jgi:hypothetical protein
MRLHNRTADYPFTLNDTYHLQLTTNHYQLTTIR